jgi:hypothetical protein
MKGVIRNLIAIALVVLGCDVPTEPRATIEQGTYDLVEFVFISGGDSLPLTGDSRLQITLGAANAFNSTGLLKLNTPDGVSCLLCEITDTAPALMHFGGNYAISGDSLVFNPLWTCNCWDGQLFTLKYHIRDSRQFVYETADPITGYRVRVGFRKR